MSVAGRPLADFSQAPRAAASSRPGCARTCLPVTPSKQQRRKLVFHESSSLHRPSRVRAGPFRTDVAGMRIHRIGSVLPECLGLEKGHSSQRCGEVEGTKSQTPESCSSFSTPASCRTALRNVSVRQSLFALAETLAPDQGRRKQKPRTRRRSGLRCDTSRERGSDVLQTNSEPGGCGLHRGRPRGGQESAGGEPVDRRAGRQQSA